MKNLKTSLALLSVLALSVAAVATGRADAEGTGHGSMSGMNMTMSHSATASPKAVQLRIALEPAARRARDPRDPGDPARARRRQGLPRRREGTRPELGRDLEGDRLGVRAGRANQFLNGKNLWRAHIKYFVDYTVATAKHDKAGQKKAVANLMVVHPDPGCVLRQGDGAAEAGARRRPDRARAPAQGSARRVREGQLRAGVQPDERGVRAHGHDR